MSNSLKETTNQELLNTVNTIEKLKEMDLDQFLETTTNKITQIDKKLFSKHYNLNDMYNRIKNTQESIESVRTKVDKRILALFEKSMDLKILKVIGVENTEKIFNLHAKWNQFTVNTLSSSFESIGLNIDINIALLKHYIPLRNLIDSTYFEQSYFDGFQKEAPDIALGIAGLIPGIGSAFTAISLSKAVMNIKQRSTRTDEAFESITTILSIEWALRELEEKRYPKLIKLMDENNDALQNNIETCNSNLTTLQEYHKECVELEKLFDNIKT